ncbi:MAG: MBOAT family protein, partial [Clostridia bacterium]|nr:MBOAT family protein [Clostridia bacterium]
MLFSSLEFLFLYMLVSLPLYFITPMKWRCVTLFAVSLVFYGWGEPLYVFLMLFTIALDYFLGLVVGKNRDNKKGKGALIAAIVINLGILAFFKYFDFFVVNLAKIPAFSSLEPLGIEMPIGISFYTFQALSYVIDVYRSDAEAQKNPIAFGTYVTLFPQLIAGPIVRYKDVDDQLTSREHSVALAASGARTFIAGLGKKVIIANTAGALWQAALATPDAERTAVAAWMGILWYTVQIYFDFSGYS